MSRLEDGERGSATTGVAIWGRACDGELYGHIEAVKLVLLSENSYNNLTMGCIVDCRDETEPSEGIEAVGTSEEEVCKQDVDENEDEMIN